MILKQFEHKGRRIIMSADGFTFTVTEEFDTGRPSTDAYFTDYTDADMHFSDLIDMENGIGLLADVLSQLKPHITH